MLDQLPSPLARDFQCEHCGCAIRIPADLPPTTAPCPACHQLITSPALELLAVALTIAPPADLTSTPGAVLASSTPQVPAAATQPPLEVLGKRRNTLLAAARECSTQPKICKLILAAAALLILAACVFLLLKYGAKELMTTSQRAITKVKLPPPDSKTAEAIYLRSGWQKEAYQVLAKYLAAPTSSEKLPFILNAKLLAPQIEAFYGGGKILDSDTPADGFATYELGEPDRKRGIFMLIFDQPQQYQMSEFFRPLASIEVQYGLKEADLLLTTMGRVGTYSMERRRVYAFFKRTPEGLKLDWEIFAQTKYRTFKNFVEIPDNDHSEIFRVFTQEDVPEKGRTVPGVRCYRLSDPANIMDTVRVNVAIDSEIGRKFATINWRGTQNQSTTTRSATVELKWVGPKDKPQLTISRFICWEFLGLGGQETVLTPTPTTR